MTDSELFRNHVVKHAKSFIGQKEIKGNMGFHSHQLDILARDAGFKNGYAWCAVFCEVVWKLSIDSLQTDTGKVYRTLRNCIADVINPSSQQTYNNAANNVLIRQKQTARPGDIVIFINTKNRAFGHAGIVTEVTDNGFWTVEGNTNENGSAEGDGVYTKFRTYDKDGKGLDVRGFLSVIEF